MGDPPPYTSPVSNVPGSSCLQCASPFDCPGRCSSLQLLFPSLEKNPADPYSRTYETLHALVSSLSLWNRSPSDVVAFSYELR